MCLLKGIQKSFVYFKFQNNTLNLDRWPRLTEKIHWSMVSVQNGYIFEAVGSNLFDYLMSSPLTNKLSHKIKLLRCLRCNGQLHCCHHTTNGYLNFQTLVNNALNFKLLKQKMVPKGKSAVEDTSNRSFNSLQIYFQSVILTMPDSIWTNYGQSTLMEHSRKSFTAPFMGVLLYLSKTHAECIYKLNLELNN